MKYTLNFVFDEWDNENKPLINSHKKFGEPFNRNIDDIMDFFIYNNYKKIKIENIKKYPNENFYYLIWSASSFEEFLKNSILPINDNVLNIFKKYKNLKIILLNEQESEGFYILKLLDQITKKLNLDQKRIWFINNNYKLNNLKILLKTNLMVYNTISLSMLFRYAISDRKINIKLIPQKKEPNLFICQNNKYNEHRFLLLILLRKYKIIKDVDWSLIHNTYNNFGGYFRYIKNIDYNLLSDDINFFKNISKKTSKYESTTNFNINNEIEWSFNIFTKTFENSYFNITTESHFIRNVVHITEKSFKPFYYYQYPLILASHHHIKYMKLNYDFDFFDDVIDHSYDNIINNTNRIFKFVEEIKRIQENKDFFIKFYEENQDRFIKNHKIFMNLNNNRDINFFNSLI